MRARTIVAIAMLAAPAASRAQSASPDTLFARSPWGAEAAVGANSALSFLKLSPSGGAWLFSVMGTFEHFSTSASIFGAPTNSGANGGSVSVGLGRRQYHGTSPLRPYLGAGVIGTLAGVSDSHSYGVGGYGEFGAAYFLAPRFSVGLGGALTVGYTHNRVGASSGPTSNTWIVTAPAPTVRAAVFF